MEKWSSSALKSFMELCEWIKIKFQSWVSDGCADCEDATLGSNNVESRHCFTNIDYTAKVNGQSEDKYRHQRGDQTHLW